MSQYECLCEKPSWHRLDLPGSAHFGKTLAKHKDVLKEVCRNHPVRDMKAQTFLASAADRFQVLNKNPITQTAPACECGQ